MGKYLEILDVVECEDEQLLKCQGCYVDRLWPINYEYCPNCGNKLNKSKFLFRDEKWFEIISQFEPIKEDIFELDSDPFGCFGRLYASLKTISSFAKYPHADDRQHFIIVRICEEEDE